jgi:hypothetical protein
VKSGEKDGKKDDENIPETKVDKSDESSLPIKAKEDERLILVDDEKKALALGAAETSATTENNFEAEVGKTAPVEEISTVAASTEKEKQATAAS